MTVRFRRWILPALTASVLLIGAAWIKWDQLKSPRAEDRTILVFPFRSLNMSEQASLGAVLAEKVNSALTESHQLTVQSWDLSKLSASPSSIEAPTDEAAALRVGSRRPAGYILLGQFAQLGTRTEIVVRLLRVRDGHPVWSGTYWRDSSGMTAFPSELAQDVAEALGLPRSAGARLPTNQPRSQRRE